ncbi:hypothetical protein J5N97_018570 [Dioscorea zingiberensis]|uniref:GPI inositol-deacylase n=1 Tax=Dioscorea zingiberensis TaxID=325984 RepID=A0A9D5CC53_9LILI|nr:hypothetical protein J5N97_018570 [Dioscorea zingiberensis]
MANASRIKEIIEKLYYRSRKRVVILGHSKGGVDSAAALSIYWNQLKDKVVGLVLAQSPYAGNPVASDILRPGLLKHVNFRKEVVEIFMSGILNGDLRAIEDLTYEKRMEFLRSYPLPREIPVVSFHTETCNIDFLKLRYREKSDGIVTRKDAEAPGSVVVRSRRKLDHAWIIRPCLNEDPREANNSQLIEALFTLLVEVADRKGRLLLAN